MKPALRPEDARLALKAAAVLGLVLVLAAALVLPARRRAAALRADLERVRADIARQETLAPAYARLVQAKARDAADGFGFPARQPLDRQKLQDLPGLIQDKAKAAGLEVLELNLDANSVLQDRDKVMIQGVFSGGLSQFRLFFVDLQGMPSLGRVERLEVRAVAGALEFFLQMRFALT